MESLAKKKAQAQMLQESRRRAEKREEDEKFKRQKQEFKKNDYKYQFNLTLEAAKALCRVLDSGKDCISCGTRRDVQYAAGHYKSAGAHPGLALDLRNIHRQCNRYCNCGLSGNISGTKTTAGYAAGLISRYGPELLDWLEIYHPPAKRTTDELIALRKVYAAETRRLESGLPPSKDWRALDKSN